MPTRVLVKRKFPTELTEIAPYKAVDFHANQKDFLCVMLAAIGWSTRAIAKHTKLTESQVGYRIAKAEQGRKKGDLTQRAAYRNGTSNVAVGLISVITANRSPVRQHITKTLDKRGLYNPRSRGVLRDDKSLPKR